MPAPKFTTPPRPLTWLITGCSSGLGLALARTVQAYGHNVIATSRNPERTPDLAKEVESSGGKWIKLDVDARNCGDILDDLENSGTEIDVLVNNAGFSIHQVAEQFTDDELREMMETLYFGPCRLMRAVVPRMRKRRFGVVVNISSGAGLEARESMGGYGAAKAALDGYSSPSPLTTRRRLLMPAHTTVGITKTMAKEVAEFNVRALYVSLGAFNTNMTSVARVGQMPLESDYQDSVAGTLIKMVTGQKYPSPGDKDKAAKAIFDVVTGQGAGAGHEAEVHLPLGSDSGRRVFEVRDKLTHAMDVFGGICNSVGVDD